MKTDLKDVERAWLAGVLSAQGTFKNGAILRAKKAGRSVSCRWELISTKLSLINRVAAMLEVEPKVTMRNKKEVKILALSGDDLHELMRLVWPWLITYRKHQYARTKQLSDESVIGSGDGD